MVELLFMWWKDGLRVRRYIKLVPWKKMGLQKFDSAFIVNIYVLFSLVF